MAAGHGIGDIFALLDITPGDAQSLKQLYTRYPQLVPGGDEVRVIRDPSTRAYGRTVQLPANDVLPFRILPYEPTRVKAIIQLPPASAFTGTARIGQSPDLSGGDGFTLYGGQSLTVESVDDIYILVTAAVGVSVWTELNPDA